MNRLELLTILIERDGPICQGVDRDGKPCRRLLTIPEMEADHIVPKRLGGSDLPHNRKIMCRSCNDLKRSRSDAYVCVSVQGEGGGNGKNDQKEQENTASDEQASNDNQHSQNAYVCVDLEKKAVEQKEEKDLTPTQRVNRRCENPFRLWMESLLEQGEKMTEEDWQDAGAERFNCSPETIGRYIRRMRSREGKVFYKPMGEKVVLWWKDAYLDYQKESTPLSWLEWYDKHRKEYDRNGFRK